MVIGNNIPILTNNHPRSSSHHLIRMLLRLLSEEKVEKRILLKTWVNPILGKRSFNMHNRWKGNFRSIHKIHRRLRLSSHQIHQFHILPPSPISSPSISNPQSRTTTRTIAKSRVKTHSKCQRFVPTLSSKIIHRKR